MADNVNVTEGSGRTIAADDVGGVHYQRVKISVGADGVATDLAPGQAAMAASLPVAIAADQSAVPAAGDVAHDAADSGSPQKIGGVARTGNPAAVADGDRTNALFDKLGKQIAVGAIRELKGIAHTRISDSTSETTIVPAEAGVLNDLYGLILANTGASPTTVSIRDATAGAVRATFQVPAGDTRGLMLPVDSAMPQAAANNNWTATCSAATTALEVTALFVKNT